MWRLTLSVCGKFEPENVQNASVPPEPCATTRLAGIPRAAQGSRHGQGQPRGVRGFERFASRRAERGAYGEAMTFSRDSTVFDGDMMQRRITWRSVRKDEFG